MFSDGSSFVFQGQRYAGAAVTTDREVLWQQTLPPGTSAQCAELIALTKALKLGRNKSVNIYTDSRYAFATAHVHRSIYQERGLLTAEGKAIKNKAEILDLLAAIWEPARLAIIHCPGHQKGISLEAVGNRLADAAAREAALTKSESALELPILTEPLLPLEPSYTPKDLEWISRKGGSKMPGQKWFQDPEGDLVWVKRHEPKTLEPRWKEPHTVILTTPTAAKLLAPEGSCGPSAGARKPRCQHRLRVEEHVEGWEESQCDTGRPGTWWKRSPVSQKCADLQETVSPILKLDKDSPAYLSSTYWMDSAGKPPHPSYARDEETKAQAGEVTYLRSLTWLRCPVWDDDDDVDGGDGNS
ncbi:uncharacterized protein LOC128773797 [Panthera pardus]|uniref:Uncharacterized protein LOC128773797 n=1 Tax=Panthera pardus TaxID=9691 RepID=A0A9W2UM53_PANPR|nr:uncharacterized protein LOC128773797 [Panthera pardus]